MSNYPEEAEAILQKWADERPIVTNADKFREVFGTNLLVSHDKQGYFYIPDDRYCIESEDMAVRWLNSEYKAPELDVTDNNAGKMEAENDRRN